MIDIFVSTTSRPENYIYAFISNFRTICNSPLNLVVGHTKSNYLDKFKDDNSIFINKMDEKNYIKLTNKSEFEKIGETYKRCLEILGNGNGRIVFEDDVLFSKEWSIKSNSYISKLSERYKDNFILCFFTSRAFPIDFENYGIAKYPHDFMVGTHGIYYPESVRVKFLKYLNGLQCLTAGDIMLRSFVKEYNIPLFVTIPCLIEHIGIKSTWDNSRYIQRAIEFCD